eukprot:TRINITY_DN28277_c0_g1_i1.p1 TRINITY_DN28277_c0_g1~~TRINITY_DN28277_c0_g1_i1.p1  ORF type:complete len:274 (+),score=59.92 TRINITY_DN28277_c0_g1_i1:75-896(+)
MKRCWEARDCESEGDADAPLPPGVYDASTLNEDEEAMVVAVARQLRQRRAQVTRSLTAMRIGVERQLDAAAAAAAHRGRAASQLLASVPSSAPPCNPPEAEAVAVPAPKAPLCNEATLLPPEAPPRWRRYDTWREEVVLRFFDLCIYTRQRYPGGRVLRESLAMNFEMPPAQVERWARACLARATKHRRRQKALLRTTRDPAVVWGDVFTEDVHRIGVEHAVWCAQMPASGPVPMGPSAAEVALDAVLATYVPCPTQHYAVLIDGTWRVVGGT